MSNDPQGCARLFSIGYSNHALPRFLDLLRLSGVTALADVRSSPYSKRWPQFNRPDLEAALSGQGLVYVFLGDLLGGRPRASELYDEDGRVDYERVRATPAFRQGLERLIRGTERHAIAMMCGEDDPLDCHRGLMITPALAEHGLAPLHLRKDGSVETTAEMEARLLRETRLGERLQPDLFTPPPTEADVRRVLAEAYRTMSQKKAYRRKDDQAEY
jgi:uncharacterized protein (DUF488 family)